MVIWSCDTLNLDGTVKDPSVKRDTYSNAQKMRASMTYMFGRVHGLGTLQWQENESGEMKGNPSVCEAVSTYMISLRRRKVQSSDSSLNAWNAKQRLRCKRVRVQPVHMQLHQ